MSEKTRPMFYNVRLGAQPINWCNDDMNDLGDEYSFEMILDEMAEAGYAGTEVGRKYPRDPVVLREALKGRGLVLTSGWCDVLWLDERLSGEYFARFQKHVELLEAMGCDRVVACEIGGSTCWDPREDRRKLGVKKMDDAGWKRLAAGLTRCGEYANAHGMTLVYHVHTGTVIETAEETARLCGMTDPATVCLLADTGHLHYCGVDVPAFFERFAERIRYVHLKDIRQDVLDVVKRFGIDFNSSVRINVFTVPGDGCIDYRPILAILARHGYQGWLVVEAEQNPKYANPLQYAKVARSYLAGIAGI